MDKNRFDFIVAKSIHDGTAVKTHPRCTSHCARNMSGLWSQCCIQMTSHFHTAAFKAFTDTHIYGAREFFLYSFVIDVGQLKTD